MIINIKTSYGSAINHLDGGISRIVSSADINVEDIQSEEDIDYLITKLNDLKGEMI